MSDPTWPYGDDFLYDFVVSDADDTDEFRELGLEPEDNADAHDPYYWQH